MNKIFRKILPAIAMTLAAVMYVEAPQVIHAGDAAGIETIADGVYIATVDVGGLTKEEAAERVNSYVTEMQNTTFTFDADGNSMQLDGSSMNIQADVDTAVEEAYAVARYGTLINRYKEKQDLKSQKVVITLPISISTDNVAQFIELEQNSLESPAVDNTLYVQDGVIQVIEGTEGQTINIPDSLVNIVDFLENDYTAGNTVIQLAVETTEPQGSVEELSKVQNLLGSYSTDYSSSTAGRAQNVETAVSKINGTILYPGEEFSVYNTISPFTEENGYQLAASYGAGVVTESLGGGVCQVSTTLYNAVIRAELEVTKRYNHSMLVHYVQPSEDAAIASGLLDMTFVNNLDAPVYIEGYCYDGVIYFRVYGEETRPSNRTIAFESETVSEEEFDTTFELDDTIPVGSYLIDNAGSNGCVAKLWKIVYVDGVEESKEVFNNSSYDEADRKLLIGIQGASDSQIQTLSYAISTGDEDTIVATVESYGGGSSTYTEESATGGEDYSTDGTDYGTDEQY